MKTLILYATKHGATREIANRLAARIKNAVIYDLKQSGAPPLAEFDCVIVGTSIYAGMIRKEAKTFIIHNAEVLHRKMLGLYLCGMDESKEKEYFNSNFPADVLQTAKAAAFLGGIFDPKKTGTFERFIMKMAAKQSGYTNTIDDIKIQQFTEKLKSEK